MKKIVLCLLMIVFMAGLSGCDNGGHRGTCNNCGGDGKIECYKCDGLGKYYNGPLDGWYKCGICMGRGYRYCSECDN